MRLQHLFAAVILIALPACKKKQGAESGPGTSTGTAAGSGTAAGTGSGSAPAGDAVITVTGFNTPESVLYDGDADVYLVSNIVGSPDDKDGKGSISRVTPDGKAEHEWIVSGVNKAVLNAPKGMTLVGDTLYVADIDVIRMFDRKTGAPKGEFVVAGSTFLNDLDAADGTLWATDSGIGFGPDGVIETHSDAVFAIDYNQDHKIAKVLGGDQLGHPNGIVAADGGAHVVTFGSGEMYNVVVEGDEGGGVIGTQGTPTKLPKGQLDGIIEAAGIPTLVSSWEAKAVFAIADDGKVSELISGVESPADIGWDHKRRRVLIPLFTKNTVEIHPVK